jgi:hypothetical protein
VSRACTLALPLKAAVQGDRRDRIGDIDEQDVFGRRSVRRSGRQ